MRPSPVGLEFRTFVGSSGTRYQVMLTPDGGYHVFAEVEALDAARDCGIETEREHRQSTVVTRQAWAELFAKQRRQEAMPAQSAAPAA
jgi:hypothetical protein